MPLSKSPFIISSVITWGKGEKKRTRTRPPRNDSPRPYYRCGPIFDRLNEWLRSKGVKANKPLHEMRKEIGSQICAQAGIYAASVALRHSSINLTREFYIDKKQPAFLAISKLIK